MADLLVCGGAVVDCILRPADASQRGASRTSMPGEARVSLGGVGRNLAEVARRLGCRSALHSAVGNDEPGARLLGHLEQLGIQSEVAVMEARTATYTALLDGAGELVGAVADMGILDAIPAEAVAQSCENSQSKLVLCEANLSPAALKAALQSCRRRQVPAWFDPVSVAKAPRGACGIWQLAAPNWDELLAMLGRASEPLQWESEAQETSEEFSGLI
ncbi:unnamed protein product [Effrenium voratum]|nr:unnamed protein product [Effrenium voratum]